MDEKTDVDQFAWEAFRYGHRRNAVDVLIVHAQTYAQKNRDLILDAKQSNRDFDLYEAVVSTIREALVEWEARGRYLAHEDTRLTRDKLTAESQSMGLY